MSGVMVIIDQFPFTDHLTQFMWHRQNRDKILNYPDPSVSLHIQKEWCDWHQVRMDRLQEMFHRIMLHEPNRVIRDWMRMCYP